MKKLIIFIAVFLFGLEIVHKYPTDMITGIAVDRVLAVSSRDSSVKIYTFSKNGFEFLDSFNNFAEVNSVVMNDKYIVYSGRLLDHGNELKILKFENNRYKLFKNVNIGLVVSKLVMIGDLVAATTMNSELLLYDIKTGKKKEIIPNLYATGYKRYFYGLTSIDNRYLAFVNWGGDVYLYDIKNDEIIKHTNLPVQLQDIIYFAGKLIVSGYDDYIYVLDKNLKLLNKIYIGFNSLNLGKNKENLFVFPWGAGEIRVFDKNLKYEKSIKTPMYCYSLANFVDDMVLFNCSEKLYVTFKDFDFSKEITKDEVFKPYLVGIDGNKIYLKDGFSLVFDLDTLYTPQQKKVDILPLSLTSKYGSVEVISNRHYKDTLIIYDANHTKRAVITKNASNGYSHRAVGWIGDLVASGGTNGEIYLYTINGDIKAVLKAKNNTITSINYDKDTIIASDNRGKVYLFNRHSFDKYAQLEIFSNYQYVLNSDDYFVGDKSRVKNGIYDKEKIKKIIKEKKQLNVVDLRKKGIKFLKDSIYKLSYFDNYLIFKDD